MFLFFNRFRGIVVLSLFFFFTFTSYSQVSNFTFNVSATNETCLGNGAMTFVVGNTVSGSTIDYRVYLLPNVSVPLVVLTTNSLTGLNAGNYRVVATQSLGGVSFSKQQDVVISNVIVPFAYSLSGVNAVCGNDGKIIVNITSGSAASYQIIAGPVLVTNQGSNIFAGLPAGLYQIRVINTCGEGLVQTFTLLGSSNGLALGLPSFPVAQLPNCNSIQVVNSLTVPTGSTLSYPLQIQYTVFPPGGASTTTQNVSLNSGLLLSANLPYFEGQNYTYNIKIIDGCGTIYNFNNNQIYQFFDVTLAALPYNCANQGMNITPINYSAPYTISFLSGPIGFNPLIFNNLHPGPFTSDFVNYGSASSGAPVGTYSVKITDSCGRSIIKTIILKTPEAATTAISDNCSQSIKITSPGAQLISVVLISAPTAAPFQTPQNLTSFINSQNELIISNLPVGNYVFQITTNCTIINGLSAAIGVCTQGSSSVTQAPGCALGFGSIRLNSSENISELTLVAAPASYLGPIPSNLTASVSGTVFYFGSVPQGNYSFKIKNSFGVERTDVVTIAGYQVTTNDFNVTENCGSFNLFSNHQSTGSFQQIICLQKLNVVTNQWGHPLTGVLYTDGTVPSMTNSFFLNNNATAFNLAFSGQFRVLKRFQSYNPQGQTVNCFETLYTFTFSGVPKITNVYTVSCANGSKDVIVAATGIPVLKYRITTKNGISFVVENGNSNTFTGLSPAVYNFQVEDLCGNLVNSIYDVTSLPAFVISASSLCDGQSGSLSVPNLSFLNYRWWKDNASTITLSSSSQLNFSPYSLSLNAGVYHVQISNPNNITSCINTILNFTITASSGQPNAGIDNVISLCGSQGQLNLNGYLITPFDSNGVWTALSPGVTLNNNLWNAAQVPFGNYQFKYKVIGTCAAFDEAIITVVIKPIPNAPIASVNALVCEGSDIYLVANSIPNATYNWFGPNGFYSTDQNPVLANANAASNGIYGVKALINLCESSTSIVNVTVEKAPNFSLSEQCVNNKYIVSAVPIDNSYYENAVVYAWEGPNNFINNFSNSIDISRLSSGVYTLTITNSKGCSTSKNLLVYATACEVQLGVSPNGDSANDSFDLSGFNVEKLKIFNRYGLVVFEQNNYSNQWNGQDFNGNLLPSATYFYSFVDKLGETRTGWVYLQR